MSDYVLHVCVICAVMALGFLWEWISIAPHVLGCRPLLPKTPRNNPPAPVNERPEPPSYIGGYQPKAWANDCDVASLQTPKGGTAVQLRRQCKCPNCSMWNEADYDDTDGKCWVCGANIDKAIEEATGRTRWPGVGSDATADWSTTARPLRDGERLNVNKGDHGRLYWKGDQIRAVVKAIRHGDTVKVYTCPTDAGGRILSATLNRERYPADEVTYEREDRYSPEPPFRIGGYQPRAQGKAYDVASLKPPKGGTAVEPPGEVKVTLKAENRLTFPGVTRPKRSYGSLDELPQPGDVTPLGLVNSVNVECDHGGRARATVEYV